MRTPGQFRRSRSPPTIPTAPRRGVHIPAKKINVCQEPYEPLCVARQGVGICTMPSSEYFRRQADICLRLSMIASSEEVANRLIAMAQDYTGRADEIEADSTMAMPTMTAPSASPDRKTNQT